jgi:hypothetical protein
MVGQFQHSAAATEHGSMLGRQVPKPRCLSPASHSLDIRIVGRQVPKPRCLSPAAHSLEPRTVGRHLSNVW